MILLLGAWGLCLYITSRSLMDDARREEAVLHQPAEEFDDPDELPPLYWEGYDRGYEDALESMAYTRPPRVRHPRARKKVLSLTTPPAADARTLMQPPGWARVSSPGKCRERKECSCEKKKIGKRPRVDCVLHSDKSICCAMGTASHLSMSASACSATE